MIERTTSTTTTTRAAMLIAGVLLLQLFALSGWSMIPTTPLASVEALSSTSSSAVARATLAHERLRAAVASPSKNKLTYSVELDIPEPRDATSILLQSNAIQTLSKQIRTCQTHVAFVRGSINALATFVNEQQLAQGNFPGPVPIIYCGGDDDLITGRTSSSTDEATTTSTSLLFDAEDLVEIANAGAEGVLIPIELCLDEKNNNDEMKHEWIQEQCRMAINVGLQPVPEMIVPIVVGLEDDIVESTIVVTQKQEQQLERILSTIADTIGCDPVAVLMTTTSAKETESTSPTNKEDDDDDDVIAPLPLLQQQQQQQLQESQQPSVTLPILVPPTILTQKRIPILGSVRVEQSSNNDNDENDPIHAESVRYKECGGGTYYTGVVLRSECVPTLRRDGNRRKSSSNLEFMSLFWSSTIQSLKSTRSKSFGGFRAKNHMDVSAATKWSNYQRNVLSSGALGDMDETHASINTEAGDYQGF